MTTVSIHLTISKYLARYTKRTSVTTLPGTNKRLCDGLRRRCGVLSSAERDHFYRERRKRPPFDQAPCADNPPQYYGDATSA